MERETVERKERVFLTHADGTGELYNLQLVKESELPEFFQQFMVTEPSEPEEYRDDHWTDAAERWLFFDATNLSEERIEEILEAHNNGGEPILERSDFLPLGRMVSPVKLDGE